MNPAWNIALKELYTSVKSKRFIVIMGLYLLIFGLAVYGIKDYLIQMGVPGVESNELGLWGAKGEVYMTPLAMLFMVNMMIITVIGAVLGAALGSDAINREIETGTAKVLLGHPVYRDEVINGKFLGMGTLIVLTNLVVYVAIIAVMLILGIPIDGDSLLRGSLAILATMLYTLVFLSIGVLFSTLFKKPETSMLAAVGLAIFLTVFYGIVVEIVAPKFAGPEPPWGTSAHEVWRETVITWMTRLHFLNPAHHYTQLVQYIFGGDRFLNYYLPLGDSFTYGFNNLAILLVMLFLPFAFAYVRFMTSDIN
ncbi:ABC-2 type transport system permease protein [Thermococcus sp. 4557]|uniref:ABC transporter permease n=1 Tax=Thermococcus sp. (strain CGMCC 1.5172 / 4557) TaxID=1042877 RepID=UPI000219EB20|nr:ABC transporter permease [Thermococcus sp. 4557]AEK72166.1 ABC-2 type transport system permease protein [Thermococcus sp. 4557]